MPTASAARSTTLFLALTVTSLPGRAIASPSYPGAIARALDLPCEPQCTLCHTRSTGGFGTVNTPFGRTARIRESLQCCSPGALGDALEALRAAETDSDGDGAPDIEEIEALTDPNDEADVDLACMPSGEEDGGCSVARSRGVGGAAYASIASLLVIAAVAVARVRGRRLA